MNLLEVAKWIQEADHEWHSTPFTSSLRKKHIFDYVMRKGRGKFNPNQIEQLIDMEDSYDDGSGMKLCSG